MFGYKFRRKSAEVGHTAGKILFAIFVLMATLLFLVVIIKAFPNNHPIPAFERLADLIDYDGSLTVALKSNTAVVLSTIALLMSVGSVINTMNSKASFNVRDVAAADRFTDWCTPWALRCVALTRVAGEQARAFRTTGNYANFRLAIGHTLSVAHEISLKLGDGKAVGSDFRYLEARPLFDSEALDAFLAAVDKTNEFSDRYRELLESSSVNHIDRIEFIRDVEAIAEALAQMLKQLRRFSEGRWKDQVAH
ncbi:hypothetical protein HGP17_25540 [Rhizobium sp. P38BS-XIX]|uniref:hypothetical protein n=1 Tax=Rhizobium sp. P38BS-XIX TaxID=2726740 RepID=UPI0014576DED|nr:hypothetical protein [Rhizobium sp. P38BS-XIX]NLS00203.1 hypothetical protein [Rhizobium sp. P38BS-XIX]